MFDHDPSTRWLIEQYRQRLSEATDTEQATTDTLWLCDENLAGLSQQLPPRAQTLFISNRYDIANELNQQGHRVEFSDFATGHCADASVDAIFYRLSKEKPVVHYLLNQIQRLLKPGGTLYIAGHKNEGAKRLLEKTAQQLGSEKSTRKQGLAYTAAIQKRDSPLPPLPDEDYTQLREITRAPQPVFFSKPGQFGWRKIDAGSEFLLSTLQQLSPVTPAHLLDLGCGYGFLAISAATRIFNTAPAAITLTDNNAAALLAAEKNCALHQLTATLCASDAGNTLSQKADLLLCNPPFHQGFSVSGDLTEKFLAAAARLTTHQGQALFVVNSFIPLEQKARRFFAKAQTLANNQQFKVIRLCHQKQ